MRLGVLDGILRNLYRIFRFRLSVDRHINLLAKHLQLLDSRRTINVAGDKQWTLALLALEFSGKFAGECCLTGTLQTRHQNHCRIA